MVLVHGEWPGLALSTSFILLVFENITNHFNYTKIGPWLGRCAPLFGSCRKRRSSGKQYEQAIEQIYITRPGENIALST